MKTKIEILECGKNDIEIAHEAARSICEGGVILYPTDTIYGIGCDASNEDAVGKIFTIKKRSETNPALMLASSVLMVESLVEGISPIALDLMKKFWPGPLTLLFRSKKKMSRLLISEDKKIGIRIPNNQFCLSMIDQSNTPVVSTSANLSGVQTSSKISDLKKLFIGKVNLIIDNGDFEDIIPSTIVDVTSETPVVVREGVIKKEEISSIIDG
ncbi:MAG: threonylcarbamoyl-AMP synthase [Ignavibacteriales bacterium]|nr:threonylcarbamoyl-AMP synthase [Ignavibacteriales bacterium]